MEEKAEKGKVLVCFFAATLILALMTFIAWFNSIPCHLELEKPTSESADFSQLAPLKSADGRSQLRFKGFVKYERDFRSEGSTAGYLRLNWRSFEFRNNSHLVLKSECATLEAQVERDQRWLVIEALRLRLTLANGEFDECVTEKANIRFKADKRYLCERELLLLCTLLGEDEKGQKQLIPVASLAIQALELELGTRETRADKQSSEPPFQCGQPQKTPN